jgi:hypothetical protein
VGGSSDDIGGVQIVSTTILPKMLRLAVMLVSFSVFGLWVVWRIRARRAAGKPPQTLDELSARFEGLLERMQTPAARRAMQDAFDASPAELGRAATEEAPRDSGPGSSCT